MDLHKKFSNSTTVDISMLSNIQNSKSPVQELINIYDKKLLEGTLNTNSLKSYHMLLCCEYQKKNLEKLPQISGISISNQFSNLKDFSQEQLLIIYEIIILKLIFISTNICKEFENFQKNLHWFKEKETRHLYMKIIECFLDALRVLRFLDQKVEKTENLSLLISRDIATWYKNKDDLDWKSLISLMPKLIEIIGFKSLNFLWNLLQDQQDLENSLTGLCIFTNASFESEVGEKEDLFSLFNDERLWGVLLPGLKSRQELRRKQALHLFKIITEFLKKQKPYQKSSKNLRKIPFSCDKNSDSMDLVRNNYILILESLEEKKQHMVLPSLSLLNNLVSAYIEHENCCFDFSWLSCLFEKILEHENNTVIKWGTSYILKMDSKLYDLNFIKFLTKTLNNRFLYEWENNHNPPKIVEDLKNWFVKAACTEDKDCVSVMTKISWDPIPIFYITFALSFVKLNQYSSTDEYKFLLIRNLVEKIFKSLPQFWRRECQMNIINAMTRSTDEKEIDLQFIAISFAAFLNEDETLFLNSESWITMRSIFQQNVIKKSELKISVNDWSIEIGNVVFKNVETFARVFVMLCDLNLLKENDENVMTVIDLLHDIHSIESRPYIDLELVDRIIELIHHLIILTFGNPSTIPWKIILPYLDSVFNYLLAYSSKSDLSYETVKKYSVILSSISRILLPSRNGRNLQRNLEREAIYSIKNSDYCSGFRRLYGLHILEICQELKDDCFDDEIISLLLEVYTIPLNFEEEDSLSGIKGKATTEYYTAVGKIINCYLEKSSEILEDLLCHASTLYDKAGISGVPFVIGILSKMLKKDWISEKDLHQFESLIRTCWKSTFEGKKNRFSRTAFDELMKLILNSKFLELDEDFVLEFINEILREGKTAPNLKIGLLKNLEDLDPKWIFHFQETILNCLFHGQALRRDARIELQTLKFLWRNKCPESKNQIYMDSKFYLNHNLDSEVRARAIVLFHKAINGDENYSSSIFPLMIGSLKEFKKKRYYGDSNAHRIQQRIFQALLILEPVLNEECKEKLRKEIIDIVLSNAADQPSIQIMMSWILSRIYSRTWSDGSSLWNFFKEVKAKRPGNVKFVAGVILQISILKKDDESWRNFFKTAISYLAPECLGPSFNTRLACQIVLVKLYEIMPDKDNLYEAIIEALNERKIQIANEFYYKNFHSLHNYSLQSIYYEVPRLTNMSEDELIPPTVFEALGFSEFERNPLKLMDESNSLSLLNLSDPKVKSAENNEIPSNDSEQFDLQKKIVPNKSTIFEDKDLGSDKKDKENESIIVVASLVERVPNLGGIARTCEVFGASELVLGNKKCTENKEFQSLSVTAEKWINVTEVKPHELSKYLLEMKDKGWELVGLEQTVHSSSLLETNFKKKTVLVLGNEKDGIPPHLIPILDTCVEIPQIGLIRSLNVHVTGAICIWEYAKQHSFKC